MKPFINKQENKTKPNQRTKNYKSINSPPLLPPPPPNSQNKQQNDTDCQNSTNRDEQKQHFAILSNCQNQKQNVLVLLLTRYSLLCVYMHTLQRNYLYNINLHHQDV